MILGACYLLIVDMLARTIALIEIRLGILTAAVGAPSQGARACNELTLKPKEQTDGS
jgi:hypothetical protein